MRSGLILALAIALTACASPEPLQPGAPQAKITRWDKALDAIVSPKAKIEKVAEGFTWSEGPVWIRPGGYLLFTDVPANTMYRFAPGQGLSVFLKPSGYSGPQLSELREPGANGLAVDQPGSILVADSGNRVVARLDLESRTKTVLASTYDGRRFNSPNDIARRRDGIIYFTDPPYGLRDLNASPVKELPINGVYRLDADGNVTLIEDQLSFPNGVELSPDERTLYVSNSDPNRPIWMAYTLDERGAIVDKRVFNDASDLVKSGAPGLPDGMCMAADGHLFATAPGGVVVFTPAGQRLGRIETGTAVANCAFGDDGRSLYLTSDKFLARVRVLTIGHGFQ
jgi:gluconolactonase